VADGLVEDVARPRSAPPRAAGCCCVSSPHASIATCTKRRPSRRAIPGRSEPAVAA
jgi:hypothetical protein